MALTPILGILQVATNQSSKETTINDAILALEAAGNGMFVLDYTSLPTSYILDETLFSRAFLFKAKNASTSPALSLPRTLNGNIINRIFVVKNDTTQVLTVKIAGAAVGTTGATGLTLPEGSSRLIAMEGDGLFVASEATTVSRLIDLADVPGTYAGKKGLTYRVNDAENGIEFAAGLTISGLYDTDVAHTADGDILKYSGSEAKWVATPLSVINTFLGLGDTPHSYAGMAGYLLHVNAATNALEFINPAALGGPVTGGGNTGQILTKNSATDGDYSWQNAPATLPTGGTAGQYLRKNSGTNGDAVWDAIPAPAAPLPTGGGAGQLLAKRSNADDDVEWVSGAASSGIAYSPAVINAAAHGGMNHGFFTLPWTPTPGNALLAFYFSNVAIAAASGWTELAALPANGYWGNCRTFAHIVLAGDSAVIDCCNTGTADAIVVYEIDMRYLKGGLASLAPFMAYNDTAIPTITTGAADIILSATANRGGTVPVYTVTGDIYNTLPETQDGAASDRYVGGVYIQPAAAAETINITYAIGTGGSYGVYAYLVIPAIPVALEEAPTDGSVYVRSLKKWVKQAEPLPIGGGAGQILAKQSTNDQDAAWVNPPAGVPTGGTAGQLLLKNSGNPGDYGWTTKGFVPASGQSGYALVKNSGNDYDLKWIALPTAVPVGGANGQVLTVTAGVPAWINQPHDMPTGGAVGQYLVKSTTGDFATAWGTGPSGVPAGGGIGQILTKNSNTDGDLIWANAPKAVPAGGTTGQILTKSSGSDYALVWSAAPISLPAGGSTGQVLVKNSAISGDASWSVAGIQDAPTDGQLYARINSGWQMFAPTGGTGGGTGGASIVRPHRFWRINIATNNGSVNTAIDELGLHIATGGSDIAVGGTPVGTMSPQANAFDEISGTEAAVAGTSGIIGYDFGASNVKGVLEVQIGGPVDPTKAPQAFAIQYSDDGSAWTTAWAVTGQTAWAASEKRVFTNSSPDYITATYTLEAPTDGSFYVRKNGAWAKQGTTVPNGGAAGQLLSKNSITDGDIIWIAPPQGIPAGGASGQVLGKASLVDGDVAWRTVVSKLTDLNDLPNSYATSGGLLLAINASGTGVTFVSPTSTQIIPSYGTHAYWRVLVTANGGASFSGISELGFKSAVYGSNLTTGGAPLSGGYSGSNQPSLAFDGSAASEWTSNGTVNGAWIGYHFAASSSVREVNITGSQTPSATPLQFAVQYSDDGTTWAAAWTVLDTLAWTAGATRTYRSPSSLNITDLADAPASLTGQAGKVLSVNTAETGYQLTAAPVSLPTGGTIGQVLSKNSGTNGDASWTTLQSLPTGGTAGQVLTKHSSTTGDAIWSTPAIAGTGPGAFAFWQITILSGHGTVAISELQFRPQSGGGNQTTGGSASASTYASSSYAAAMAFDGSPTTCWTAGTTFYPQWLEYAFTSPVEVREIAITSRSDASYQQAPLSGVVQYSSDGVSWLQGFTFSTTDNWAMSETRAFGANYGLSTHDLLDIDFTTAPTDGQAIVYDASTEKFKFATPAAGSGGTISAASNSFHVTAVGTGSSQVIVLPSDVTVAQVMVFVNGLRFAQSELSIAGADLTITTNEAGASIEIVGLPTIVSGGSSSQTAAWDFRPPRAADFIFVDDGVHFALTDDADVGLLAYAGPARGGDAIRAAIQPVPSGDFTVISKLVFTGTVNNYGGAGLCLYDATGANKIICFGADMSGNIYIRYFYSPAGYISVPYGTSYPGSNVSGWYKITRTGTDLNFYYSNDGKSWNYIALGISQTDLLANAVSHFGLHVWYNRSPTTPSNDISINVPYLHKSW